MDGWTYLGSCINASDSPIVDAHITSKFTRWVSLIVEMQKVKLFLNTKEGNGSTMPVRGNNLLKIRKDSVFCVWRRKHQVMKWGDEILDFSSAIEEVQFTRIRIFFLS